MRFKPKACRACAATFQPTGPAGKFCAECAAFRSEITMYFGRVAARARQGGRVGVGSGGANRIHAVSVKDYRKVFLDELYELQNGQCWSCANEFNKGLLLVHHLDHNRRNNVISNLELTCKRCHQIEHECWLAFSKGVETIPKGSTPKRVEAHSPA